MRHISIVDETLQHWIMRGFSSPREAARWVKDVWLNVIAPPFTIAICDADWNTDKGYDSHYVSLVRFDKDGYPRVFDPVSRLDDDTMDAFERVFGRCGSYKALFSLGGDNQ